MRLQSPYVASLPCLHLLLIRRLYLIQLMVTFINGSSMHFSLATFTTTGFCGCATDSNSGRRCRIRLGGVDNSFLDVGCQVVEGLVDVDIAFSRDF